MDGARRFLRDHECGKEDEDELDYLKLRQNFKESLRKNMQKKLGSVLDHCRQLKTELPTDNYGSFFGPSLPSIARRVIQEATTMPEAKILATDNLFRPNKKSSFTNSSEAKSGLLDQKPKAQKLKESRDYSFLLSDGEPLVPTTEKLPTTKVSASGVPSSKVPSKTKQSVSNLGRKVTKSQEEKKHVTGANEMQHKARSHEVCHTKRPSPSSENARNKQYVEKRKECPGKQGKMMSDQLLSTSNRRGPDGRTYSSSKLQSAKGQQFKGKKEVCCEPKRTETKLNLSQHSRKHHPQDGTKSPLLKSQSLTKQQSAQEKEFREPKNSKEISQKKQCAPKHQTKRPRQDDSDEDVDDVSSFIRRIFRYDPLKHVGIDGDHDRLEESKFDDIQKEEKRSAKLARKEDEIERKRNEQEEREDRLKRQAKKLKIVRSGNERNRA